MIEESKIKKSAADLQERFGKNLVLEVTPQKSVDGSIYVQGWHDNQPEGQGKLRARTYGIREDQFDEFIKNMLQLTNAPFIWK